MVYLKKKFTYMNDYYIYCYLDPRKPGTYIFGEYTFDFEPIYIGKGRKRRCFCHKYLYEKYTTRFYSKYKAIVKSNNKPKVVFVKTNLTEDESFEYEKYFINLIGRIENSGTLTNLSDGGEGQSGFKFSEETKRRMSKARKGMKLPPRSDEYRKHMSEVKKGKPAPNLGISMSEEAKIKMSLAKKGKYLGKDNPMFGKNHSEESRKKISENRIRLFGKENPLFGRKHTETQKIFDTWELTNNSGEKLIIDNLTKFCRENNLNQTCMRDIYYGRMKTHKNWVSVKKLTDNIKAKKRGR